MYTMDDIVFHTGVPADKAAEICNLLVMEGYLILDKETGKYRITKDRDLLEKVKKLWNQCKDDYSFEQMSGKIEDIIEFGKPLALSEKSPGSYVKDIGVPGLNFIFGHMQQIESSGTVAAEVKKIPGLPRGHCILIKGAPGTGKTTMGMQIALHLKQNHYRSLFLTFEEDVNQLIKDFEGYMQKNDSVPALGWKKSDIKDVTRSLIKIRTPHAWENPDVIMDELIALLDKELPHLIVIDSISRFRDLGGDNKSRQILRRLIRHLKCRRITSIFTGEAHPEENTFEEYEVDGIINLEWVGDMLTMTVKKLRGLKAYKGPHSAALMSVDDLRQPQNALISQTNVLKKIEKQKEKEERDKTVLYLTVGFNVFPDISVYKSQRKTEGIESVEKEDHFINTGTEGLDELLSLPDEEKMKGFKRKETILLVGSAGSGKTLLALNFMQHSFEAENKTGKEAENMLWINLEGDIDTLKFATRGFKGGYGDTFRQMLQLKEVEGNDNNMETRSNFLFIDFPPINLDLNKIVFTLAALHNAYRFNRLVIDSITELERAKGGGQPAVKVFLAGLIQFLRDREITTIFVCRSDAFFRSIDKIEEQVSSLVDLIICIRNFDIHNQIQKGIYIQKARGRYHNSKIMRLHIDSKQGIKIEDSGWDLENLLAGDTSFIKSPQIFFKLFYENPAEECINKKIIDDFDNHRYPGDDPKFTLVRKPNIYTEFWSFKGQFSAGHANTRVLSIPDYVISAFRDNDRLAPLGKYVKTELLQNIESEKHLIRRYQDAEDKEKPSQHYVVYKKSTGLRKKNIDAVPCYRDYGVMVFRKSKEDEGSVHKKNNGDTADTFENTLEALLPFIGEDNDNDWLQQKYKWTELRDLIKKTNDLNEETAKEKEFIPFAFPPLDKKSEFVAFFMELLWSHGGDIFKSDIKSKKDEGSSRGKEETNKFNKKIQDAVFFEFVNFCFRTYPFEKLTKALELSFKTPPEKGSIQDQILSDFEKKFVTYGLEQKDIKIEDFKKWLVERIEPGKGIEVPNADEQKTVLKLNDKHFKDTIKLILQLVYGAGVVNPIEGEFRHRAILSRNWYSRIFLLKKEQCRDCRQYDNGECLLEKKFKSGDIKPNEEMECIKTFPLEEDYRLLPLPLGKVILEADGAEGKNGQPDYYRSVTCLTYWSLVMLKNALSPEIGGNFIESLNAPDYQEERLKNKTGMPVTDIELKKERFKEFDPDSYAIFGRILDNSFQKLKTTDQIKQNSSTVHKDYSVLHQEFIEHIPDKMEQLKWLRDHRSDFDQRLFFAQVRQSRTAFYQLEEALHYQLKQLFIKSPAARDQNLYGRDPEQEKIDIVEEIIALCKKDGYGETTDSTEWEEILDKISSEFRTHVIFELLSYFFHEFSRGAEIGNK